LTAKPKSQGPTDLDELMASAERASSFLKALANENRLMLLCLLANGDKAVSELKDALGMKQSAVSQQLARLRADNLVTFKRQGKTIRYALASEEVRRTIGLLYELYCEPKTKTKNGPTSPHP
jgi:DNA-binding transcriptional ArsR family regulator